MKACTRPEQISDSEARRRMLKALSDEKVKSWPNTLQATRVKKENWKKERLEKDETALAPRTFDLEKSGDRLGCLLERVLGAASGRPGGG